MIDVESLRNPQRKSGFTGVRYAPHPSGSGKPYQANKRTAPGKNGIATLGPRRATAEEAAQDYCDYVNGQGVTPAKQLRTAGHGGKRDSLSDDPEVQAALGVLRDAKGQREGKQGYVYCIRESTRLFVKVGFSTNPQARVAELQCGNPRKLELIGMKKGTLEDERALHQKYIKQNVLQEWFCPTKKLLSEFDLDSDGKERRSQ